MRWQYNCLLAEQDQVKLRDGNLYKKYEARMGIYKEYILRPTLTTCCSALD